MTNKYADVGGARAQRPANYIRTGHYLARIDRVEEGTTFKKEDFVAANLTILKVFPDSQEGFDYDRKVKTPLHAVGEAVTDFMAVQNVAFNGRIKGFASIAGDLNESDWAQENPKGSIVGEIVGATQPLSGVVVEIRADLRVKKEAKAKPEAALTGKDVYTQTGYVRRVPFAELKELLDEATIARHLPDLEASIAAETQAAS